LIFVDAYSFVFIPLGITVKNLMFVSSTLWDQYDKPFFVAPYIEKSDKGTRDEDEDMLITPESGSFSLKQ
jgi:hypothetical protein